MGCLSILRARLEPLHGSQIFFFSIVAALLLMFAGSLYAQNKACEKTCLRTIFWPVYITNTGWNSASLELQEVFAEDRKLRLHWTKSKEP